MVSLSVCTEFVSKGEEQDFLNDSVVSATLRKHSRLASSRENPRLMLYVPCGDRFFPFSPLATSFPVPPFFSLRLVTFAFLPHRFTQENRARNEVPIGQLVPPLVTNNRPSWRKFSFLDVCQWLFHCRQIKPAIRRKLKKAGYAELASIEIMRAFRKDPINIRQSTYDRLRRCARRIARSLYERSANGNESNAGRNYASTKRPANFPAIAMEDKGGEKERKGEEKGGENEKANRQKAEGSLDGRESSFLRMPATPLVAVFSSNVRCASDSLFIGRVFRRDPISSKREGPSRSFCATHHCSRSFRKSIETPEACPRFSSDRATAPLSIGNEYIGFGMVFGIHSYRFCGSEESAAVCKANVKKVDKTACNTNEAKGCSGWKRMSLVFL